MIGDETLDCQDCGQVLKRLSPHEARQVAERPYDFVLFCNNCRIDRLQERSL